MTKQTWPKLKVALLLSYICIASLSAAIITPALPIIEKTYTLNHGSLEWIVSIFLVGYVFGQLIYGPLANRYGRKKALQGGLCLNILGILVCLIATHEMSYGLLLVGRLVTALGAASGLSCTFMLLNESLPDQQIKSVMPYCSISFTVGIEMAVLLGGWLSEYASWTDCFWVLLAHGLLMLLGTTCFEETLQSPNRRSLLQVIPGLLQALKNKKVVIFSLAVGMCTAVGYSYSAAAPLHAHAVLGLSAAQYGYWNLINMFGMLGSGFLSAYWMKRHGVKKALIFALTLLLPAILALLVLELIHTNMPLYFFGITTVLYLLSGVLFPTGSYFASNAITDKASAASAMSFMNMGSATLAVVVLGYLPMQPLAGLVTVLGAFFLMVVVLVMAEIRNVS